MWILPQDDGLTEINAMLEFVGLTFCRIPLESRSVLKYAVPSEDALGGWRFATPHLVHVLDVRRKMWGSNVARPVRRSRDMVIRANRQVRHRTMDLLIASVAHSRGAALITANGSDFMPLSDIIPILTPDGSP